jgi:hypothetical protein
MTHAPHLLLVSSLLTLGACRTKPDTSGADSALGSGGLDTEDSGLPAGEDGADGDGGDDGGTDGSDGSDGTEGSDGSDGSEGSDGSSGSGSDSGGEDGGDEGGEEGGDAGGETDGSGSGTPATELCNGIDDDGDGEIDEGACPETVVTDPSTGRAYMLVATHMDWPDAQAHCLTYGYTLATIDDATENELVWELVYEGDDGVGYIDAHTWLGYHEPVGDSWQWDGAASTYENFDSEVITDGYGTVYFGQAAAFGDSGDQYWHEAPMTWRYASVCESP